ncbi:MAG: hypothetical protein AAF849_15030 [Bacteroidota bacterium]
MVDVQDVSRAIYAICQQKGLHGKNYILSSESWRVSDIAAMLNGEQPTGQARIFYESKAAQRDLGITFHEASVPLHAFSS